MFEEKIEKVLEYIYKLAFSEGDMLLKTLIDQFYSIRSDIKSNEGIPIRQILLEAHKNTIELDPNYYQGLIFLGFAYYELKLFEKTYLNVKKALNILDALDMLESNWAQIADYLIKVVDPLLNTNVLLEYFDVSLDNIKRKMGDAIGATFLCPECGSYNTPESIFCLGCGKKFTKKDKKGK